MFVPRPAVRVAVDPRALRESPESGTSSERRLTPLAPPYQNPPQEMHCGCSWHPIEVHSLLAATTREDVRPTRKRGNIMSKESKPTKKGSATHERKSTDNDTVSKDSKPTKTGAVSSESEPHRKGALSNDIKPTEKGAAGATPVFDFTKLVSQFRLPGVDFAALVDRERKNIEALAKANRIAFEGWQRLVRRQAEIFQETMKKAVADAGQATPRSAGNSPKRVSKRP